MSKFCNSNLFSHHPDVRIKGPDPRFRTVIEDITPLCEITTKNAFNLHMRVILS